MAVNLDSYAPYDDGAYFEDSWRKFMRHMRRDGVLYPEANNMEVFADSTGMQVKIRTGEVWIRSQWGENTSEKTQPISTAHGSLARIDRIVCRNNFTANRMELDTLTGTPSGSPTAPSVTQNTAMWEISLATVSVPALDTGIDAAQVTDARTYAIDTFQAYKTAQETVVNNTMQDDNHLFVPAAANSEYVLHLHAIYAGPTAGGMRFEFSVPAGATIAGTFLCGGSGTDTQHGFTIMSTPVTGVTTSTGVDRAMDLWATLVTGNAAGRVRFRWAQDVTNASPLAVGSGSSLTSTRVIA